MKKELIIVCLALLADSSLACMKNPLAGVAEKAFEHMNQSDFVFVGEVLLHEPLKVSDEFLAVIRSESGEKSAEYFLQHSRGYMAVKFEVEEVLKGSPTDDFVALNDISWDCSFSLTAGDKYMVFGSRSDLGNVISVVVGEDEIELARENLDR